MQNFLVELLKFFFRGSPLSTLELDTSMINAYNWAKSQYLRSLRLEALNIYGVRNDEVQLNLDMLIKQM